MYKCPNCRQEIEIDPADPQTQCSKCGEPIGSPMTLDASDDWTADSSDGDFDLEIAAGDEKTFASTQDTGHQDDLLLPRAPIEADNTTQQVESIGFSETELGTVTDDENGDENGEDDEFKTEVATEIYDPDENQPTIEVGDGVRSTATLDYAERMISGLGERLDGDADYIIAMDEDDCELGSGASGVVYKATQKSLDRLVAIKLLKKQVQAETQQSRKTTPKQRDVEKFLYESQITAGLDHPNVITVHDLGVTANDTLFYSMKLFEGGRDWSKDFDRNSLEQNLDIFNDVCDALRRAHRDRIIHRDLKPQNVLVGDFGEVQVTDWGLALDLRRQQNEVFSGGGTPCYMSPEMALHYLAQQESKNLKSKLDWALENSQEDSDEVQLIRDRISENEYKEQKYRLQISELSDTYVLGAILFQIAAGYPPHLFQVSDAQRKQWGGQAGRNKVRRELELAATRTVAKYLVRGLSNPEAREALRDIALRAMAPTPSDRYQNVAELQQAVRDFRDFMRCIEDTHRGHREVKASEDDPKSYVNLTNAIYAYEGALESYPEYEPAKNGQATAKFLFAERALNNQDFELGLSTITPEAIEEQSDKVVAAKLRSELITQRNRRDRRKKLLFVATMASLAAIAMGVIFGVFAFFARLDANEQTRIAEQKRQEAEQAGQELFKGLNELLASKEETIKLKVESEIGEQRLVLQTREIEAAKIGKSIADLDTQRATLESEDATKRAKIDADLAKIDVQIADFDRIAAEIASERIKETTQFDQYINQLKSIEADIDEDITQSRLRDLFMSQDISLEVKNGWELHHLYKRANPALEPKLNPPLGKIKMLESSADGAVVIAVSDRNRMYRCSTADPEFSLLNELPLRDGKIVSLDVSENGRWLVVAYESISKQSARSKTDSVPIVYDLLENRGYEFGEPFGDALQFQSLRRDSDGKLCPEKFFCNVQHVQILEANSSQFKLFMVDQRQALGLNQFRCSVSDVTVAGGELVTEVEKVKVAGQLFSKEPGLLNSARCLATASRETDGGLRIAIINSYPKFSLLTFSFAEAAQLFRQNVANASPREEARYFEAMNRNRVSLDDISPGFAPTALCFVQNDAKRLSLMIGNGKGEVAAINFQPSPVNTFMLAASSTTVLVPANSYKVDNDSKILSGDTVRFTVKEKKQQRVVAGDPATRRQLPGGRIAIHKSAVRAIEAFQDRFVSVSESEALIWEFEDNKPMVNKRLFGQSGTVADLVVFSSGNNLELHTVSNLATGVSELRHWTPDETTHDATIRLTDFRGAADTRKIIVSGSADQRPGSEAITLGFDDGSIEYFSPEAGRVTLLKSKTGQIDDVQEGLSQNDFRNGKFEYFAEQNQLVMYSNSAGLLVWNRDDTEQTDPIRPVQSAKLFDAQATNSSVFLSADKNGENLVTSHPMSRDKILLWQRNADQKFVAKEIGPFAKDRAPTAGLNVFVQPTISPNGEVIAAVLRLRNGYQVQLIRNSASQGITKLAVFDSPPKTSFRSIQFLNDDRIVLSEDRVERGVERKISIVELKRTGTQWKERVLPLPESLENGFRQLSLAQVDGSGEDLSFVGFGIEKSEQEKSEQDKTAAYTSTDEQECNQSSNSRELLVWNSGGVILRRNIPFSRRIAPRFEDSSLHYMVAGVQTGETILNRVALNDPEESEIAYSLRHNVSGDAATRWQFLGNDRMVYVGKDWFRVARRVQDEFIDQFGFSLANPAAKMQLAGNSLLVHHQDGSGTLLRLDANDVQNEPVVQRLNGFSQQAALSPDGSLVAAVSKDGDLELFTAASLMKGAKQAIAKLDDDAIALTWIRAAAIKNLGANDVQNDCLVSLSQIENGLKLKFWSADGKEVQMPASVGELNLEQPRQGKVKSFDIAGVSGKLLAIVWESTATDRADIFKFAAAEKPNGNDVVQQRWFLVDDSKVGQIESVAISEPMEPSISSDNVATRLVIGSVLEGSKSVKLYALELGIRFTTKPLLELFVSDKLQQVDEIVDTRFCGDGKTLLTMTSESAQLRLSGGWSGAKQDVVFEDRVKSFQAELKDGGLDQLQSRRQALLEQKKNFQANGTQLLELQNEMKTQRAVLKKIELENAATKVDLDANEIAIKDDIEAEERKAITQLENRIEAMEDEAKSAENSQ